MKDESKGFSIWKMITGLVVIAGLVGFVYTIEDRYASASDHQALKTETLRSFQSMQYQLSRHIQKDDLKDKKNELTRIHLLLLGYKERLSREPNNQILKEYIRELELQKLKTQMDIEKIELELEKK